MHDSYRMSPEAIRREGLGKEVRSLLRCRHMDQLYLLSGYLVANPVVLDIDVLGAQMMHWIHGKLEHPRRARALQVDVLEELSNSRNVLDGEEAREVLSLHGRHSHDRLKLPVDWATSHHDEHTRGRPPCVLVTAPV